MDDPARLASTLFTQAPWVDLSWPAVAMLVGTLIGMTSKRAAGALAIVPRTSGGLTGIVTAPFIHTGIAHWAANLPPFLVLGTLVAGRGGEQFPRVMLVIAAAQGALLWLFGRRAAHVGMSGVIFGLFGYLIGIAWFTRTTGDVLVGAGVLAVYGGLLAGVAPARNGTSWEGHLFGLIAGLGTAWLMAG